MKKVLLMSFMLAPGLLWAQGLQELRTSQRNVVSAPTTVMMDGSAQGSGAMSNSSMKLKKAQPYSFIEIGSTTYDLQTNHSVGNRIILHEDGSISAVWTTSPDQNTTSFPNRGTGYNYFTGTDWGASTNTRLENVRVGWPSIGVLGNGDLYTLAHDATGGGFAFSTKPKGSGSWSTVSPILDDVSQAGENRAPIWNRSASSGDYIHLVCTYTPSGNNVDVVREGVTNPVTYSRSTDNGATWDKALVLLPGYDSTRAVRGTADAYEITVKDSVVAIVVGGYGEPMTLWKSTDNGDNFTMIDVDGFQYPGTSQSQWFGDTIDGNDGAVEVLLDNDYNAHVFWGGCRYVRDFQNGDTSVFYFPGTSRVMHWKEGMAEPQLCGISIDRDFSNTLDITTETITGLDANGQIPNGALTSARYSTNCVTTFPSAAIDANGDIYLVFSSPSEYTFSFLNANFRDVLVSFSTDNGDNWALPQNLTQDDFNEHVFASLAETADGNIHMVWQVDDIPGTNLQNNDANASNHLISDNKIMYAAIPTSAIKDGSIGEHTVGVNDVQKAAEVFFVNQSYPNPNSGSADVTIFLLHGADVNLEITDMYGKVINSGSLGYLNGGNHIINIDASELASGMYFYTISTNDHSMTRKMQVK